MSAEKSVWLPCGLREPWKQKRRCSLERNESIQRPFYFM